MRRIRLTLALATTAFPLAAPHLLPAQKPTAPAASFEVASLRLVEKGKEGRTFISDFDSNHFVATNASLLLLICIAYAVDENQLLSAPAWLGDTFYDVSAKAEGDAALSYKQLQPVLQHLLEQRLHLATHRGVRQVSGFALITLKSASNLKPVSATAAEGYIMSNQLHAPSISLASFAAMLSHPLGKPVRDETGLRGNFAITLNFAPAESTDSPLPSIFTAVQQQLGLKLEPRQVQQQTLSIDHVDRTPIEN